MNPQRVNLIAIPTLALAILLAACGGSASSEPRPTPTPQPPQASPTVTPVPLPEGCPLSESVCELADDLKGRIAAGDYAGIASDFRPLAVTCPVDEPGGAVLCEGVPNGGSTDAYALARRYSEGYLTYLGGVVDFLRGFTDEADASASDAYGDGGLRLIGYSCAEGAADACSRAAIIFSAILLQDGRHHRELLVFWLDLPAATSQPIDTGWNGIVLDDEAPIVFESGGSLFDLGEVYVLEE